MAPAPLPNTPLRFNPLRLLINIFGLNVMTIVMLLLIATGVLLAFKGRALYRAISGYRAEKIAEEAMGLINAERWEGASHLLVNAFRSMPDQPALLRAVAELSARGNNDPLTAAVFVRKIVARGDATPQDVRRLAELILQSGDVNEARRVYGDLPAAEQTSRKGLELLSAITRQTGSPAEADAILRRALMLDAGDAEAKLRLAIMDEQQALDSARSSILQTIWNIASAGDSVALKAIEYLSESKTLTAGKSKDLIKLVEKNPHATERIRYAALRAQVRLNPLDKAGLVEAETARNKKRSVDSIFDFLRWLGALGEYQKILDIVPAESVARDADVFLVYVDALAASERWKELQNLMTTRKTPVTETTAHVILAQCYAHLQPDLKEARRQLTAALAGGRAEIAVLVRAAALAENLHLTDIALQGYKMLSESKPASRVQILEKIVELYRNDRNARGMMQTLRQLRELRPNNQGYVDQLNYLRLVTGEELEFAYEEVVGFGKPVESATSTGGIPNGLLRGLAAYRFGDEAQMKDEIGRLSSPELLPAGLRATACGLLTLSGRDVESYRIAEKILPGGLLNDEITFLRRSLAN